MNTKTNNWSELSKGMSPLALRILSTSPAGRVAREGVGYINPPNPRPQNSSTAPLTVKETSKN
jgi:hypothetical protein